MGLIVCVLLIASLFLEAKLQAWLEAELKQELVEKSEMVSAAILSSTDSFDDLADRLGEAAKARVTLMLQDGTVVGDSIWTPAEIEAAPNHRDRAEIQKVLRSGTGTARSVTNSPERRPRSASMASSA